MSWNIVVTDYNYDTFAPEEAVFREAGMELQLRQCRTEDEVIEQCREADAVLNQYAPLTRRVLEALPELKVISRYGVGVNTVDMDAASSLGIVVANVPDYCQDEVSDHAMALLLDASRSVTRMHQAVTEGTWDYKVGVPGSRLRGQTLGLAGFGSISRMLAEKAQAFGLKVVAYDPYVTQGDADPYGVEMVLMEDLLKQSDFVSIHLPQTQETEKLFGEAAFQAMKPAAVLINTARGPVVDEAALTKALDRGDIGGAALDVLEVEPPAPDHPLIGRKNVILTPHAAFYSEEAIVELKRKAAENVRSVLSGTVPPYVVNRDVIGKTTLTYK
ncbi:C-terminal binding protein [Alkalicoccus urumqiensis]|uniref:Hydroxyacid dehydrogenase n=1 Tax=Alkalicoccus urumqiensis TaxID=1548213 RepID=A0A2P6MJS9_ALKUR|nr:C-terminal binding protein [Alkalicoccus urumqiensis]PRO66546.1 hydroxyacid dehydrogenase [Alkalicoccus urumqiensis]